MSDVGKRLKEERDKKHLTQVQVFTKTGINNKTLSGYENGVSYPDYESLKILADYYEVSTDYLLGTNTTGKTGDEQNKTNFIIDGLVKKYNLDLSIEGEREKLEQFIKLYADLRNS